MSKIKVIKISPKGLEEIEIDNELTALQKAVGGYIESDTRSVAGVNVNFICDEEGNLKAGNKISARSKSTGERFVGTLVLAQSRGASFAGLSDKAVKAIKSNFDNSTNILMYD